MVRILLVTFAVGLLIAVGCMAGAISLGLYRAPFSLGFPQAVRMDDGGAAGDPVDWTGPDAVREIAWSGADGLDVNVPAEVTFTQGPQTRVIVTGPAGAIGRVELDGGRLRFRGGQNRTVVTVDGKTTVNGREVDGNWPRVRIAISAPNVRSFVQRGTNTLKIQNYNQDTLAVEVHGRGDVLARGRARLLDVEVHGSGDSNLAALAAEDADVEIKSTGSVTIAPAGTADIEIEGDGDVTLITNPKTIRRNISGYGKIIEAGPAN